MHEERDHDALENEIKRGHFVRAALMAAQMDLAEEETRNLRHKALWQMSAVYRNARGTESLAQQFGCSREELKNILKEYADTVKNERNTKPLEPCYDYSTGKYFSFEEWMGHYLRI